MDVLRKILSIVLSNILSFFLIPCFSVNIIFRKSWTKFILFQKVTLVSFKEFKFYSTFINLPDLSKNTQLLFFLYSYSNVISNAIRNFIQLKLPNFTRQIYFRFQPRILRSRKTKIPPRTNSLNSDNFFFESGGVVKISTPWKCIQTSDPLVVHFNCTLSKIFT